MIDEPEPIPEPLEAPQDIEIILGDPSKVLKIRSALSTLEKTKITTFLRENQDVFAWKHEDMPGIDKEVIQHRFNVNFSTSQCRRDEGYSYLNKIKQ